MNTITMHQADVRDVMAAMPDRSVDLLVTSPPFLALRSYLPADHPDKHREIGSEPTPADFLDTMLGLTGEWRRLLAPWASLCVEIGDTYAGSGGAGGDYNADGLRDGQPKFDGSSSGVRRALRQGYGGAADRLDSEQPRKGNGWPLAKSLCGIPTLYTWSLAYGRNLLTGTPSPAGLWRIRNLLTWTRPNPPVGALGDKFRPATSFVTVACTSDRRWFDLDGVRQPYTELTQRVHGGRTADTGCLTGPKETNSRGMERVVLTHAGAPPLDWWDANNDWQPLHNMPTHPYKGAHYATYPITLPARLILAMCPQSVCATCGEPRRRMTRPDHEYAKHLGTSWADRDSGRGKASTTARNSHSAQPVGAHITAAQNTTLGWTDCHHNAYTPGIVLDPFAGSGTTAIAAALHGRDAVLIDLDSRNVELTRRRIGEHLRIVSEVADGNTLTWTVEAALPDQLEQADGQLNIFDVPETSPLIAAVAAL